MKIEPGSQRILVFKRELYSVWYMSASVLVSSLPSVAPSGTVSNPLKGLTLRKDIWSQYPVIVVPLGRGTDGAERHGIVWHRKKLAAWRANQPMETWQQYETEQRQALIQSLQNSKKWTVEKAAHPDHICVIRMKFPSATLPASNYESPIIQSPVLTRLTDIKTYFPVVWHEIPSGPNTMTKTYTIELHRSAIHQLSQERGYDMEDPIVGLLMRALKASTAWRVLQPEETHEFCRLEMMC